MKDKTLLIILWCIGIFNAVDFFSTSYLVNVWSIGEGNAAIDAILHTPLFPLLKLVAVPLVMILIWRSRHHFNRGRRVISLALQAVFGAYAALTAYHAYALFRILVIPWYIPISLTP